MSEAELDFQKIHDDFRPRLQRYLTRLVGEFEAEDLTQEVFLRISKALPTFRGDSQLHTWIYRIATNAAVDRLRASSFKYTVPTALPEDPDTGEFELEDRDVWTGEPASSPRSRCSTMRRLPATAILLRSSPKITAWWLLSISWGNSAPKRLRRCLG